MSSRLLFLIGVQRKTEYQLGKIKTETGIT